MKRTLWAAAFFLLTTAASAATLTPPYGPQTVVVKHPQQLAQAGARPNPCARAVSVEQHDKWLSVKRGGAPGPYRASAKAELSVAALAAAQGHDQACWHRLGLGEELNAP